MHYPTHYGTSTIPETTPVQSFSPRDAALAKLTYRKDAEYFITPKFYAWEMHRLGKVTTDPTLKAQLAAIDNAPLGGRTGTSQDTMEGATISPDMQAAALDASVKRVQASLGLPATGFVDVLTWKALGQKDIVKSDGSVSDTAKKAASRAAAAHDSVHPLVWVLVGSLVGLSLWTLAKPKG
jgi:hypothetical protein